MQCILNVDEVYNENIKSILLLPALSSSSMLRDVSTGKLETELSWLTKDLKLRADAANINASAIEAILNRLSILGIN